MKYYLLSLGAFRRPWSNFDPVFFCNQLEPRVSQGRTKSVQGEGSIGSENQVAKITLHPWKMPSRWIQNGKNNLKVYGNLMILQYSHHFWDDSGDLHYDPRGVTLGAHSKPHSLRAVRGANVCETRGIFIPGESRGLHHDPFQGFTFGAHSKPHWLGAVLGATDFQTRGVFVPSGNWHNDSSNWLGGVPGANVCKTRDVFFPGESGDLHNDPFKVHFWSIF